MKTSTNMVSVVVFSSLFVTGCFNGANLVTQQNSVLVSEVVSICGALVGGQAEQRINQEWAKYPEVNANRPVIEAMANVLLTTPDVTAQQRSSQYKQYLTCATGLLMANGIMQ
jgi:hypothetical protein